MKDTLMSCFDKYRINIIRGNRFIVRALTDEEVEILIIRQIESLKGNEKALIYNKDYIQLLLDENEKITQLDKDDKENDRYFEMYDDNLKKITRFENYVRDNIAEIKRLKEIIHDMTTRRNNNVFLSDEFGGFSIPENRRDQKM